jgi:hypothetical protein
MGKGSSTEEISARMPKQRLPIRRIEDNLVKTTGTTWAVFVIPTRPWAFMTDKARENAAWQAAETYARLAGHEIHLRVTTKPYEVADWARNLDQNTPAPLSGKHPGSPWARFLVASQRRMHKSTTDVKVVFLLVKLNGPPGVRSLVSFKSDTEALASEARLVGEYVAGAGLEGRKATTAEIEWLLRRSIGLGLPAPATASPVDDAPWETEDLFEITDGVRTECDAFGQTVKVTRVAITEDEIPAAFKDPGQEGVFRIYCDRLEADPDDEMTAGEVMEAGALAGEAQAEGLLAEYRRRRADLHATRTRRERYVATVTLGRVEDVPLGESNSPWLTRTDRLQFPVEISARLQILSGPEARSSVQHSLYVIRDMVEHHGEHKEPVPLALDRQARQAQEIEDAMSRGAGAASARAHGWYRFAVSGATEAEALQRARSIIEEYSTARMTIAHPYGLGGGAQQSALFDEFMPGSKVASKAYLRRTPVSYFAAGMPNVAAILGDHRGPYLGFTTGGARRAVMFDPHYATEIMERSGLVPIIGEPGAGKSVLLGAICYAAALRGERTVVLDPSGPLAELCNLPEFAGRARHVDLTTAEPGTLNPFGVVPEPNRVDYRADYEFDTARADAAADRKMLATEILLMLLPTGMSRDHNVRVMIQEAVRQTQGKPDTALSTVVDILEGKSGTQPEDQALRLEWQRVGAFLREQATLPMARLFFPMQNRESASLSLSSTLTVLTMQGIVLPHSGVDRDHWSQAEVMAVPLLHLASWYATRAIYGSAMNARKVIALDEAHFLAQWGAGRALFNRLSRDSRKWNTCVLAASQNPRDVLAMEIENLYSTAFIGRIEDEGTARAALDMLRVRGKYESRLAALSRPSVSGNRKGRRRFVMRDVFGRVDEVEVDLDHVKHVLAALNTTAAPDKTPGSGAAA